MIIMSKRYIEDFNSGYHCRYLLYFHLVIVTKYRKPLLNDSYRRVVRGCFLELEEEFKVKLEEMQGEDDHIHFLFQASPQSDLPRFIGRLKGKSSYLIRQLDPQLKKLKAFWSGSYCLLTTGGAPIDIIKNYIQSHGLRRR